MSERWKGTRDRVRRDAARSDDAGLWNRIERSVNDGQSVALPAADPRRAMNPVRVVVLLLGAFAGYQVLRQHDTQPRVAAFSDVADDDPLSWLATPAYAQGNGASNLPPIDTPELSRVAQGRLVYRYATGADGFITQEDGSDTTWIMRDTTEAGTRLLLRHVGTKMNTYAGVVSTDSIGIHLNGGLDFWRWHVVNRRNGNRVLVTTTMRVDTIETTYARAQGQQRSRSAPGNYEYQLHQPLIPLLPALRLERGYARSISALDLLRGEMTPGFRRSVEMRVTGKEWVDLPIGRFHCWIVDYSVVPDPGEKRYASRLYVDMQSGVLVRAVWRLGESFFTEQVLADRQLSNQ